MPNPPLEAARDLAGALGAFAAANPGGARPRWPRIAMTLRARSA